MSDFNTHYNALFEASSKAFLAGNYFIDHHIKSASDNRFGLTLVIRVNDQITSNIQSFIDELKKIEPPQYYYPNSDIHVTVMSIVSCYEGFRLENISVPDYINVIEKSMAGINAFDIDFCGVTASSSAILIRGFPNGDELNNLRNKLRVNFKNSGLEESIDKRYSIFAAHITVARFSHRIKEAGKLINIIEENSNRYFGKMKVEEIELVYNDWYQREEQVKQLHKFSIE